MLLGGKYKHILQLLPEVGFQDMQTGFTKNISGLLVTDNSRNLALPITDSSDQHLIRINKTVYFIGIYTYVQKNVYS